MQETGAGKTITLQHCWASIKAHDMFDCSSVIFNGGEGFLFVVKIEQCLMLMSHCPEITALCRYKGTACYQPSYHL